MQDEPGLEAAVHTQQHTESDQLEPVRASGAEGDLDTFAELLEAQSGACSPSMRQVMDLALATVRLTVVRSTPSMPISP